MDEGIAIIQNWALQNPSPRSFFASFINGDSNSKPTSDSAPQSLNERPLLEIYMNQSGTEAYGSSAKSDEQSIGKGNSRGGLVERIAARSGFSAPKLKTARIVSSNSGSELPSPYVTIPPGLSPTTLLDSPIFLLNSLTQPSPTTGKFPSAQCNMSSSICRPESSEKDALFDGLDDDLFALRRSTQSGSRFFQNAIEEQPFLDHQVQNQLENRNHVAPNTNVQSPPCDVHPNAEEQRIELSSASLSQLSEDGYNWRKYGQKQVKGSEYPRGYYKCTHPNCQAKKKIERSQDGHITDVIYKGAHNHPKPPLHRRASTMLSQQSDIEMQAKPTHADVWPTAMQVETNAASDGTEALTYMPSIDSARISSEFSREGEEVDQAIHGRGSVDDDADDNESESKRRRLDPSLVDVNHGTRGSREPRIVVQTTSEVDVLDDGYRWRKYGQKVVKGNPNPRSYYKCTSAGCNVRKHVERASHDLKSVITTYEGRHNHDVPVARTGGSHAISAASNFQSHGIGKTPELYQAHDGSLPQLKVPEGMAREPISVFDPMLGQVGMGNNGMPGFGAAVTMNMFPQMRTVREAGLTMLQQNIKMEPVRIRNAASVYQQMMGRMPLGS